MKQFENITKKKSKNLLIVDMNNITHKAVYVHPYLSIKKNETNIYTGGLYGVIMQIRSAIKEFNIDRIVVCIDSPPYIRQEFLMSYKEGRKKNYPIEEKLYKSKELLLKYFALIGIPVFSIPGFEADDLIYGLCENNYDIYKNIIIMSRDKDLFQVFEISGNIYFSFGAGKPYSYKDFWKDYKIEGWKWPWVSTISGGHNGVPGVKGIGEMGGLRIARLIPTAWHHRFPSKIEFDNFVVKNNERILAKRADIEKLKLYHSLCQLPLGNIDKKYDIDFSKLEIKRLTLDGLNVGNEFMKEYGIKIEEK